MGVYQAVDSNVQPDCYCSVASDLYQKCKLKEINYLFLKILYKSTVGITESYAWGECSHLDTSLNREALSFREG